jgi:hypothetical protein
MRPLLNGDTLARRLRRADVMWILTADGTARPAPQQSRKGRGLRCSGARFSARPCFVVLLVVVACSGETTERTTPSRSTCEEANDYLTKCGAVKYVRSCDWLTPHVECRARCDLAASCAYFLGDNPIEGRAHSMCSSKCTCENAIQRAAECNISVNFDCTQVCNCPYAYECDIGIPAYVECRARCPPWPDPPDAGDNDRDAG